MISICGNNVVRFNIVIIEYFLRAYRMLESFTVDIW